MWKSFSQPSSGPKLLPSDLDHQHPALIQADPAHSPLPTGFDREHLVISGRCEAKADQEMHGYAATIHKAQGMTVDRAHVLASGLMDRHAAYVALTRHRDGVSLHYGRDEFRDGAALARVLGRERLKDISLDYQGPDGVVREGEDLARRYAERRGLDPLRPESAIVVQPEPGPKRPRFDGLKLGTGRLPAVPGPAAAGPTEQGPPKPAPAEDGLLRSVGRFAVAWEDALRMLRQGLPVLAHQQQALNAAQAVIEVERPGFTQEVASALQGDPELIGPAVAGAAGRAWLVEVAEARQYLRQVAAEDEAKRQAAAAQRAELDPVRARLLEERMEAWWRSEKPEVSRWDRHQVPAAEVERARAARSREVEALPDAELRRAEAGWQRQAEQERAAARQRPSPGMGM